MASNRLPKTDKKLSVLGTKMHKGIEDDGAAIPITLVNASDMLALLTAFNSSRNTFNSRREAKETAYDNFHVAEAALTEWLGVARSVLAGRLGQRWSAAWVPAGFVNNSTAVPDGIANRIDLAAMLKGFFLANPTYEVPSMDVTAAKADELHVAVVGAEAAVALAERNLDDANTARTAARDALVGSMLAVVSNLERKLAKNDPRWLDFGLRMPSTRTTPGKPEGLTVTFDGIDTLIASCDRTALATRFRFRMRQVGPGFNYKLAASSPDPLVRISPVPPGVTLEVIVQAVNEDLQGVPSDPFIITIPAAVAPESSVRPSVTTAATETSVLDAIASNGSGNGSANGKGSRVLSRKS